MSARLAASSGDTSYVRRYQEAVPELDRVITDACPWRRTGRRSARSTRPIARTRR